MAGATGPTVNPGDRIVLALAPRAGALWLRTARATMRLRWIGRSGALPDDGGPVIYAFWHDQLAMMPWVQLRPPSVVAVSRSRDGELTVRLFERLGVEAVRGSSSRGGSAALRGLVRAARSGKDLAITPDGPRGPRRQAKEGAAWLAQATGRPLLPVAFAARPRYRLGTWDRLMLPVPFGRGAFVYGEPLWVDRSDGSAARREATDELGRRLGETTARAEDAVHPP